MDDSFELEDLNDFALFHTRDSGERGEAGRRLEVELVVKSESLPQGLTESMLEGAVVNGKMIDKADEEGRGDINVINSEIKGFEAGNDVFGKGQGG